MRATKRATADQTMYKALYRVVNESGFAADPLYVATAALTAAWKKAKAEGYLRPLDSFEVGQLLRTKRAARTLTLAVVEAAAEDETRDIYNAVLPSLANSASALVHIASDIEHLNDTTRTWYTLTELGAAKLAWYERTPEEAAA